jgi:parvulin-like peptidyl-prolyl isomerase
MLRVAKLLAIFVVLAAVCLSAVGCGGSSDPVVARVGSYTITNADVEHWIRIEAGTSQNAGNKRRLAKGQIPVPPDYADCVALLLADATTKVKPSRRALKARCAAKHDTLKKTVLSILISYYWEKGEAARRGVRVSDAEVAQYIRKLFQSEARLQAHLRAAGEHYADEQLLVRSKLLAKKLASHSARNARTTNERNRDIQRYVVEQTAEWTPQTSCTRGYVVPGCKQYRAPQS